MKARLGMVVLGLVLLFVAASPAAVLADEGATSLIYPIDQLLWNDCAAEAVHVTGSLHMVLQNHYDESGAYHFHLQENWRNLVGTGQSSGTEYRVTGAASSELYWVVFSSPVVATDVEQLHFIGIGQAGDMVAQALSHVTVNANGELAADIELANVICQ